MQIAESNHKAKLSFAATFLGLLLSGQAALAATTDAYARGMQAFGAHNYKAADALFTSVSPGSDQGASALYMSALSNQYLGNMPKATLLFKQVCDRFPDSAGCVRAQSALRRLDPAYLKRWQAAHPVVQNTGGTPFTLDAITSAKVSPNFTFGTRHVTAKEAKVLSARLHSGQPCEVTVSSIPTTIKLVNSPGSFIGLNLLNDAQVRHGAKAGGIYTTEVDFDGVKISNFPFRVKQVLNGPTQVGKDFEETFEYTLAMSDPDYERRWHASLAHHQKIESVQNKAVSDTTSNGKGGAAPATAAGPEEKFEIGYQMDGKRNIYVQAYVDNASMLMLFGQAGTTTMTPDQLRSVSGEYVPPDTELTAEQTNPGITIRHSSTVIVRSIRLGKVDKRDAPVKIEAYSSVRYQAPISNNNNPPRLGSDVYSDWTYTNDEEHHVLRFSKTPMSSR